MAWTAWWCDACRPFGPSIRLSEGSAETPQAAAAAAAARLLPTTFFTPFLAYGAPAGRRVQRVRAACAGSVCVIIPSGRPARCSQQASKGGGGEGTPPLHRRGRAPGAAAAADHIDVDTSSPPRPLAEGMAADGQHAVHSRPKGGRWGEGGGTPPLQTWTNACH